MISMLQHELAMLKKMIFGSRQEKFVAATGNPGQLTLDMQAEQVMTSRITEARRVSYVRSKVETTVNQHPGRHKLPEHLRREEIILEPDNIPPGSKKIGELETEVLKYKEAELFVKRYIRPKYLIPASGDGTESEIVSADLPSALVPKCIAGPGLLSQIIIDKYVDHLPLHRQMQRFERAGVKLPYSTLTDWVSATSKLITPLYASLKELVLDSRYIQCDETPMPVLDKEKKGSTHRGFFWVYQDSISKLVIFDYQEGRNKEGPTQMLSSFKGTIQTDGYLTYDSIAEKNGITLIHCMAHARRYYIDALDNDSERAEYALNKIQQLYAIEQKCTEQQFTDVQRASARLQQSKPILKELGDWMKLQYIQVLPKSPIGQALAYSIKRWEKLSAYADNGIYLPDNNKIENSIRPIALGRKNHLLAGSHEAAGRSAMLYSLLGTCKMHGVNPYIWLNDVLSRIAEHPVNKIKELLPHNWIMQQK